MIMPAQIKAARALLGLGQQELAKLADVGISTLKRIELASDISGSARTLWKLQMALENEGVEFIPADEMKGPGVRLKDGRRQKPTGQARRRRKA
jgi:transcriptional regulator with XRE-family HTH domain